MDHHALIKRSGIAAVLCCLIAAAATAQDAPPQPEDTAPAVAQDVPAEAPSAPGPPEPAPQVAAPGGLVWLAPVAALLGEDPGARDAAEAELAQGGAAAARALVPACLRGDAGKDPVLWRTLESIATHADEPGEADAVAGVLLDLVEALQPDPKPKEAEVPDPGAGLAGLLHAAALHANTTEDDTAAPGDSNRAARQTALLQIAGLVAGPAQVSRLEAIMDRPPLRNAAGTALARIPGDEADAALLRLLAHADPPVRAVAASALATRGRTDQAGALLAQAAAEPGEVAARMESAAAALGRAPAVSGPQSAHATPAVLARHITLGLRAGQALAAQGNTGAAVHLLEECVANAVDWNQVRAGLQLLASLAPDEAARLAQAYLANAAVRQTALEVLARAPGPALDERLAKAFPKADPVVQASILEALASRGASQTEKLASGVLESELPELRMVASEILGAGASDEDLFLVAQAGSPWRRPVALRAFLDRAHALAVSGAAASAAAHFRAVYDAPFAVDVLAEAIEGLGACGQPEDLERLQDARNRSDLREAAYRGLVAYWPVQPDAAAARTALQRLAMEAPSEAAAAYAAETLQQLGAGMADLPARRGSITTWKVLGPVPWPEQAKLDTPLFAEARGDHVETVAYEGAFYAWEAQQAAGMPAILDLSPRINSGAQDAVLYASTTLRLPAWTPADLRAGVDGACMIWVNSELVYQRSTATPFELDQEEAAIRLRPGFNQIVIKMLPGSGPCRLAVRLTDRRGAPIDLVAQRLPDDGLAGTGLRAPVLTGGGDNLP